MAASCRARISNPYNKLMPTPFESAQLNLQLFDLRREPVLREARALVSRRFQSGNHGGPHGRSDRRTQRFVSYGPRLLGYGRLVGELSSDRRRFIPGCTHRNHRDVLQDLSVCCRNALSRGRTRFSEAHGGRRDGCAGRRSDAQTTPRETPRYGEGAQDRAERRAPKAPETNDACCVTLSSHVSGFSTHCQESGCSPDTNPQIPERMLKTTGKSFEIRAYTYVRC